MHNTYRKFGIITIVAVYLLILVGGIVRSTGAGMGCPDWPRCFGQWIPPTDISQLPANYKEVFKVQGKEIADFDAFKTWVEYVNRLIGVLIGLFIFITFVLSFAFFKKDRLVFYLSFLSFFLVGFQGWLGSVVVATNLKPVTITLHMILALVIVNLLIYTVTRSYNTVFHTEQVTKKGLLNTIFIICMGLMLVQIVLGTQVRETIDEISASLNYTMRDTWIEKMGLSFYIHRSFSLLILALHIYLLYILKRNVQAQSRLTAWTNILVILIVAEITSGAVMAYFAIPAVMQPVHLLLGSLIIGVQFLALLMINYQRVFKSQIEEVPVLI
ncbi:COX15/CtaA family protein [Thermoflexibacter ruber]|uniref:Cytochrome c oxidase assembly protein subunit 15 n=1 Tax=Thermoflexibacter ruber TaxID=1003 RepID=A0A1I2IKK6_9BACT|nr:COX15/CtaA family protein [Thermoflexibacter ruber]SFF42859.1 cytochrome c oxidase assembly protein subunit 15 [Thermoflexibacter ruber]